MSESLVSAPSNPLRHKLTRLSSRSLGSFLLIKPAFVWLARRTGSFENGPTQLMMTLTILLVLVSAWVTDVIGVHPIFGSFLVGLMIPHDGGYAVAMTEKIEDLVSVIFLPLYFALSGLKTNLGSLDTGIIWGYTICIIVIAFVSKFVGCAGAARLCGFNWRESTAVGTLMSCKGLVELIVLNIGLSAGVLDTRVFSMFVVMAIVSTVATTPLTLLAYPERVRTKLDDVGLHSHHGAAIDDGANAPDEKDSSESADGARGGLAAKRLLVVLDRFEHLPALMTLVQLMQPFHASNGVAVQPPSGLCRRAVSSDAKDRSEGTEDLMDDGASSKGEANNAEEEEAITHSTPVLSSGAPFASAQLAVQPGISIDALRLIELTERTSAVMKVSESEDTMRADPLINVFRTFGHLHHVPVRSSMAILSQDDFAGTVATRARDAAADLVVVPYTFVGGAATQESSAVVSSPFESIFGKSSGGDGGQSRSSPQQAQFVRRVFQDAPCDVGLYVDRPTSTQPAALPLAHLGRAQHILLGFGGGPDDRAALRFVVRLCTANPTLSATVLRLRRVSPEESGDAAVPSVPPTVHHNMSLQQGMTVRSANNMDTVYPSHNPQSALEATLEDDLAIRAAEENAPARIELRTVSSARPLRELIRAAEAAQPSLLVVGRGRRQPTLTHREELRYLLHAGVDGEVAAGEAGAGGRDRDRALNGEQTKMVGEAAMALSLAKCAARILVLCASSRRVDEEEIRVA